MNDSSLFADEHRTIESRPPLGEDLLPPVEAPSARFLIQLFVVPAVIVLVIVGVWIGFNWLVRSTSIGPEQLVAGMEQGPNVARWQRASELADLLHNKRYPEFKRSQQAAAHLAQILNREIDAGSMDDDDIEFRKYLARALGEFEVQDGTDVLLKAAETNRDPLEQKVRDGAIQAIAVRAYNFQHLDARQRLNNPKLESALFRLAGDADPFIRFQTAYALGQIASPGSIERLEAMVDDPDADTRYNAAVALAHHGNAKAVDTLAEMLDLDELAGVREEQGEANQQIKRTMLIGSAIQAAQALAQQNPKADVSPIVKALQRIAAADKDTLRKAHIEPPLVFVARRSLEQLKAAEVVK
jgi:HEAT repeats